MKIRLKPLSWIAAIGCLAFAVGRLLAGDPPPAPAVSTYAPADDLVAQVRILVEGFGAIVASEDAYQTDSAKLKREAHTLASLALVLGLHDSDNPLKAVAPSLVAAAKKLAGAGNYDAAKQGVDEVRNAAAGAGESAAGKLQWEKVSGLGQLMKQVTATNLRLKRNLKRFDDKKAENARDAAVLAVIAQMAVYDTHEVKRPEDVDQWYQFCGQMRDAAGELNAKIKAADQDAAGAAMVKLGQSCDACHAVFRKDLIK
jgi:cytochrome c556